MTTFIQESMTWVAMNKPIHITKKQRVSLRLLMQVSIHKQLRVNQLISVSMFLGSLMTCETSSLLLSSEAVSCSGGRYIIICFTVFPFCVSRFKGPMGQYCTVSGTQTVHKTETQYSRQKSLLVTTESFHSIKHKAILVSAACEFLSKNTNRISF
jgi:hypothetical protein